jgi:hypothetical protein
MRAIETKLHLLLVQDVLIFFVSLDLNNFQLDDRCEYCRRLFFLKLQ